MVASLQCNNMTNSCVAALDGRGRIQEKNNDHQGTGVLEKPEKARGDQCESDVRKEVKINFELYFKYYRKPLGYFKQTELLFLKYDSYYEIVNYSKTRVKAGRPMHKPLW